MNNEKLAHQVIELKKIFMRFNDQLLPERTLSGDLSKILDIVISAAELFKDNPHLFYEKVLPLLVHKKNEYHLQNSRVQRRDEDMGPAPGDGDW